MLNDFIWMSVKYAFKPKEKKGNLHMQNNKIIITHIKVFRIFAKTFVLLMTM